MKLYRTVIQTMDISSLLMLGNLSVMMMMIVSRPLTKHGLSMTLTQLKTIFSKEQSFIYLYILPYTLAAFFISCELSSLVRKSKIIPGINGDRLKQ